MNKTFYITTPIYYPSGNLHIGHVYSTTVAWTLANYKKMNGYDVKFLTGADEHGQKIQQKAQKLNIDPQAYVDEQAKLFQDLWKRMDISYDYFSRTTNHKHEQAIQKQFSGLLEQGIIEKGKYEGLYSVSDEEFLTKTQAKEQEGKFYHPTSGHELKVVSEDTYFFRMDKFQGWIKDYLENKDILVPKKIVKELVNNFVDKGLEKLSVTRSTFTWGIPVKENTDHVLYVWMDALNNYITALGYGTDNDFDFQKYWINGDEIVHVVGKEITRFHGIYWPIILKAANLRQPTKILSHGWLITSEGKMSKSKGNIISPDDLLVKWDPEIIKYFFAAHTNLFEDSTFSEDILREAYNADLVNTYGNLASRTHAMISQNFEDTLSYKTSDFKIDSEIEKAIEKHFDKYKEAFDELSSVNAFEQAMLLSKRLNLYIDETKPWTLKENKERLGQILVRLVNGIYAVSTMLSASMPRATLEIAKGFGFTELVFSEIKNLNKFDNLKLSQRKIIFERR